MIVPAFGRPRTIARVLARHAQLHVPTIIVDDGSEPPLDLATVGAGLPEAAGYQPVIDAVDEFYAHLEQSVAESAVLPLWPPAWRSARTHLSGYLENLRRRSALPLELRRRVGAVCSELLSGAYGRFSRGARIAARDLLAPRLTGPSAEVAKS